VISSLGIAIAAGVLRQHGDISAASGALIAIASGGAAAVIAPLAVGAFSFVTGWEPKSARSALYTLVVPDRCEYRVTVPPGYEATQTPFASVWVSVEVVNETRKPITIVGGHGDFTINGFHQVVESGGIGEYDREDLEDPKPWGTTSPIRHVPLIMEPGASARLGCYFGNLENAHLVGDSEVKADVVLVDHHGVEHPIGEVTFRRQD
jgi:hypothetical protein